LHFSSAFISQRGQALTPSGVWRTLEKYAQAAELEDVSPHVLRHMFATQLLREEGRDLVTVA
jgi:site-specific recombinase XerD